VATTDFGCQGEASITTDYIAPGVIELENEVLLYPNPTQDYVYLEYAKVNSIVSIYDEQNKWIMTQTIRDQKNMIDVHHWPSGMYTIIIQNEGEIKTAQFLIAQ
jgi:hypothetical protein